MKTLAPIRHRESYTRAFEREMLDYLDDVLFKPLADELRDNAVEGDPLKAAVLAGRVRHDGQRWQGSFDTKISRRIRELGGFSTPIAALPAGIRDALREADSRFSTRKAAMLGLLLAVGSNATVAAEPFSADVVRGVVKDAKDQFQTSLEGISEDSVPVGVGEDAAKEAVGRLTEYRLGLVTAGVALLRKTLTEAATLPDLEDRLAVTATSLRRRAALGADQLASELVAEVREETADAFGIDEYEWVTMGDAKVRHDHEALNGRIFRFDNPPVVDTATGRRGNPGEDHNCRCFARPLIRT